MILQTIKQISCLLCLCCFLQQSAFSQDNKDKPAYTLFDNTGKQISYGELIKRLSGYDVIFLGELHNCPITHWLEFEITRSIYNIHKDQLMLGAEMFESDNQLIFDEYMQQKISYDRFEAEARLWDNYRTDYYPVVFFAKEHHIPFIATNIPRRYANIVKNKGFEALDSLSEEAKRYIAPLPIDFEYDEAQSIKDATMGWFIARNIKNKFLHINGSYHSNRQGGIIPYLLRYRPNTSIVTVTSVRQEYIRKLDDDHKGLADFYICVPEDMVNSY